MSKKGAKESNWANRKPVNRIADLGFVNRLRPIVAECLSKKPNQIPENVPLEKLGIDFHNSYVLALEVEKEFGFKSSAKRNRAAARRTLIGYAAYIQQEGGI
jgi:acyl carrier protein